MLKIKGGRKVAKRKLSLKRANLTDVNLEYAQGQQEEFVERIQRRTGHARETVEQAILNACEMD